VLDLAGSTKLKTLVMQSCRLTDDSAACIFKTLSKNPSVQLIDVSKNLFTENSAEEWKTLVQESRSLQTLNCGSNPLKDRGASAIAEALSTNTVLTNLDISYTDMSDQGCTAFADVLRTTKTLKFLKIDCRDGITLKGTAVLREALNANSHEVQVQFPAYILDQESMARFSGVLESRDGESGVRDTKFHT